MPEMRFYDPLLFLAGHRGAIERIAATRRAWMIGAILVLSAGIARNYDHLDLLREPEWFIGPFVASAVSVVFIFLCIAGRLKLDAVGNYHRQWGTFLTLAWMTAPCAWLYGIPVESMTDIITATKWNIAFLAIVSLWRVVLMTRAVAVLTGVTSLRALVLILAPAAFEMMVGSVSKSMSLVQIMGGVRLPPHTKLLQEASHFATEASFWVFVVAVIACWRIKGVAATPLDRPGASVAPRSALAVAAVSVAAWALAALPFHGKIVNRDRLQQLIRERKFTQAVDFASLKTRADFPQHYHVPPDPHRGWFPVGLLDAMSTDTPGWLREEWTESAYLAYSSSFSFNPESWEHFCKTHPSLADRIKAYSRQLRTDTRLDSDEQDWLMFYDRVQSPELESDSDESIQRPR
jgi:hypothetical protein